ncbi:MAG: ORF6N domain-containing protein [Tannerellaceae bacterium]|nr:ORF6N domain-containing protein [Tannerellaceae bacterium]
MSEILKLKQVEEKIITIRNQHVLLDSDVAALYDVETREVNQAVKNNPDKFPEDYIIQLDNAEWSNLKSKILTSSWGAKINFQMYLQKRDYTCLLPSLKEQRQPRQRLLL